MYPVLVEIGGFTITTFGVMMFLAFLTAAWVTAAQLRRRGMDPDLAWELLAWVAIGGVLGAKLYYLLLHWQDLLADPIGELTSRGGLVWYGGFIGGTAAYYWQLRRRGLEVLPMFDATAPGLALAYAVGRIGCFLVGDDYGIPTNSWIGVAFPNGAPPSTAGYLRSVGAKIPPDVPDSLVLAVHPTQLYEVAASLVIFAILWRLSGKRLRAGQLTGLYLVLYGIERFLVEFVRAKGDRIFLGISTSQMVSLLLVAIGAYLWSRRGALLPATSPSQRAAASGSSRALRK